jgi:hypothetical protein
VRKGLESEKIKTAHAKPLRGKGTQGASSFFSLRPLRTLRALREILFSFRDFSPHISDLNSKNEPSDVRGV